MSTTQETPAPVDDKTPALIAEATQRNGDLLEQLVQEHRTARAEREAAARPQPPKETEYTVEQLQGWVDAGQITKAAMDAQLRKQDRVALTTQLRGEIRAELDSSQRLTAINGKLAAAREAVPAAMQNGTPERALLIEKFTEMIGEGQDPNDPRTELNAFRAAFPDGGKKPVRETTRERARSVETTGSRGDHDDHRPSAGGIKWPDYVPDDQRTWYEGEIAKGRYKGGFENADLQKELGYIKRNADAGRRRRPGRGAA